MKNPKLKLNKKVRIKAIRRFKQEITEIVDDCLRDIRWYIVKDVMDYLKRKGIVYVQKTSKKNSSKKKK